MPCEKSEFSSFPTDIETLPNVSFVAGFYLGETPDCCECQEEKAVHVAQLQTAATWSTRSTLFESRSKLEDSERELEKKKLLRRSLSLNQLLERAAFKTHSLIDSAGVSNSQLRARVSWLCKHLQTSRGPRNIVTRWIY